MERTVKLVHTTRFDYDRSVKLSPHLVRLHPIRHGERTILDHTLTIDPEPHTQHLITDVWGNRVSRLVFAESL
ncbi:MAG: transglutaminase, partial [Magnetococcales bacterium]|nr:transglutaminase [Magnetococcales bacterium]